MLNVAARPNSKQQRHRVSLKIYFLNIKLIDFIQNSIKFLQILTIKNITHNKLKSALGLRNNLRIPQWKRCVRHGAGGCNAG